MLHVYLQLHTVYVLFAINSGNWQLAAPASINVRPSRKKMNPKCSCVIHAVSLKYVRAVHRRTGKTNSGMRKQKKIGHPGTKGTRTRNLRYNSTQSLQTTVWLVEIQHRCTAVTAVFYARLVAASEGRERKAEIRREHRRQSAAALRRFPSRRPASRRVAPHRLGWSDNLQIVGVW